MCYALAWRGGHLWVMCDGIEKQAGLVRPAREGTRWEGAAAGTLMESFPDERTARAAVEAAAERWLRGGN